MFSKFYRLSIIPLILLLLFLPTKAQKRCFTKETRELAERTAKVWQRPDPGYDPVLGYNPRIGPRRGALKVSGSGMTLPVACVANPNDNPGSGTTPKFYCSIPGVTDADGDLIRYKIKPHFKGQSRDKRNGEVYGEFLSSRFSKTLGFFADDEWVADVTCPDCEKSLTSDFQGTPFNPFQPPAGIELSFAKGIDENCNDKDSGSISGSLEKLLKYGGYRAQIDAFKLWLAFIDHGDTKADNQKFACLNPRNGAGNTLMCRPGQAIYYVSDMGSTFGDSNSSEDKARLEKWREMDPIKVDKGRCKTNAKSVGDKDISEQGRRLLAGGLIRLLNAERSNGLITRVFRASRNQERDAPPEAWTAEFTRKAKMIIDARCTR